MYTKEYRENAYNKLIDFIKSIKCVHTITRIGSGVNGYNDIYSDIDLMITSNSADDVDTIIAKLSSYFSNFDISYFKIVDFGWKLVYVILDNELEFNISVVTIEKTKISSKQACVVYSVDNNFIKSLNKQIKIMSNIANKKNSNLDFFFLTFIKKYNIAKKRNDIIECINMLNEMRNCVFQLQFLKENVKTHQFKNYNQLSEMFRNEIMLTYHTSNTFLELDKVCNKILSLYVNLNDNIDEDVKKYLKRF